MSLDILESLMFPLFLFINAVMFTYVLNDFVSNAEVATEKRRNGESSKVPSADE